ncbi:integrase family protein [Bosea sp. PAMC 26642]|uniref:integrase family protein n=1 Tax=Bosea sp. (strain PAMC 26642) TaxID=1792307 RepID=UPI0009E90D4E|nr:integrase family protein [Bosea sp. PAMC 26642]
MLLPEVEMHPPSSEPAPVAAQRREPSKLRMTEASIRALPSPDKGELIVWDEKMPGLALRIGRARRAWIYVYRPPGAYTETGDGQRRRVNPVKLPLGAWPALSVEKAREAAQVEAGKVAKGQDPAATRRETGRQDKARVSAALDDYEASLKRRRYVNVTTAMSTLRRNLASLKARDVATLRRVDLTALIEKLEAKEKPGAAADFRRHARTWLEWCTNKGLAPFNVLAGLRRERSTKAERIDTQEKGRALTDAELTAIWHAAAPETVLGRYIRAMILTGARRAEMARLKVSMDAGSHLDLPPYHTKQGRSHRIPVTPMLRSILAGCELTQERLYFASPLTGREMSGWTQHVAKVRKASGVQFTLHDFRRTMRTGLTRLGVDEDTAEMMLGHQRGTELDRIYDKHDRWQARVDAAKQWTGFVEALAAGPAPEQSNVVRLSSRKARVPSSSQAKAS